MIPSGEFAALQAPMLDGDAFDAGTLGGDGFGPAEVGVGWRHIAQAFVVAVMIRVLDERLDLALGLRMIRRSAHMFHSAIVEPFGQVAGYVVGTIVAKLDFVRFPLRPGPEDAAGCDVA